MSDGIDIPSLNFSDPHYYDGFMKRRKIRQKIFCDGILTFFRRKMTVAKSEFSSSVKFTPKKLNSNVKLTSNDLTKSGQINYINSQQLVDISHLLLIK